MEYPGLQLNQICKAYEARQPVVSEVTFTLSLGECMVLVGPSGSGKTTLLRLIAGLEILDRGTVQISGRDVSERPPEDRNVAMILQGAPLYPHMTVQQNIAFPLTMKKTEPSVICTRMAEVIPWLELEELLRRRPHSLSGGERQRVALAKALVCRPALFLLDEPLCQVDAQHRSAIRTRLKETLTHLGITTLYVTHDQREAMALADRICVVHRGRMQQVGTPDQIYHEPVNAFVGGFFGTPRMNCLTGAVEIRDGVWVLALPTGQCLSLPQGQSHLWMPYRGKTISLGIRPEHLVTEMSSDPVDFRGQVSLVERLGAKTCIQVTLSQGIRIVVSTHSEEKTTIGERIGLRVDWLKVHIFG